MFDLNAIVNAALQQAVAEAIKPLVERITALESNLQDVLVLRLAALENNPAIGVDTTLEQRVVALENITAEFSPTMRPAVAGVITPEMIVESMNKAEWLWEKVNAYIETGIEDRIERAIDDHCETYDHDSYDSLYGDWSDYDPASFASEDDLESKINDVLNNASFEVRVSL
jgi:hypothetical protein